MMSSDVNRRPKCPVCTRVSYELRAMMSILMIDDDAGLSRLDAVIIPDRAGKGASHYGGI